MGKRWLRSSTFCLPYKCNTSLSVLFTHLYRVKYLIEYRSLNLYQFLELEKKNRAVLLILEYKKTLFFTRRFMAYYQTVIKSHQRWGIGDNSRRGGRFNDIY
jgi:hypothetical protein